MEPRYLGACRVELGKGDAVKDHRVLTITCQRCSRWKTIWAYRFCNSFEKAKALPLDNTVPGFYRTGCKRKVSVVIIAYGPWY
jgi:hypothetical protein